MKYIFYYILLLSLCSSVVIHARHRGSCGRSSYRRSYCPRYYPAPFFYPYATPYWEPLGFGGGYFPGYYPGFYPGFGYYGPRLGFGFSFGL